MLQRLLIAGILAGLIVGALVTMIHLTMVTPIILEAESFQAKVEAEPPKHSHEAGTPVHVHGERAWNPEDGLERSLYTFATVIVMAVGFGLLLAAAFTVAGRNLTVRAGLVWGLAGYACFSFLPAIGLPPELPSTAAADLGARQAWWIGTVVASVTGLAIAVFHPARWTKAAGVAVMIVPHLVGAPHATVAAAGPVPPELAAHFVTVTMFMNAVMWIALGGFTAYFFARFSDNGRRGQIVDISA